MRFENPVLNRELIENLRSSRAFILQAIFVASLGTIVLVAWPHEINLAKRTELSIQIYDTFALGHLVLLALLAPVLSAPAISSERERKSLDLLLASPLSAASIVYGKLLSAIVYLLLLTVSSLPIFTVCFMLGGVGEREVMATYLLLFSTAFICGAIGLAASTWMERSRAALAVSYVVILPAVMLITLLNPMRNWPAACALTVLALGTGMLLVVLVQRRLKRPFDTVPKAADEENKDEQIGLVLDRKRFPDNLLSPRGTGLPLDEKQNPVYAKELRHELFGQGTLLVRLLLQVSLIAALPFFIASLALRDGGLWLYSFYTLIFVMLIAPSLAASVFTQERESGTFDLLLTTALGKRRILAGKLLVNLRTIAILTGFLLPFLVLQWVLSGKTRGLIRENWVATTLGTLMVIATTAVLVVLVASFFSMICRTTLRSMVFTYLTIALLFIVPVVLYTILTTMGGFKMDEVEWLGTASPFYTLASLEKTVSPEGLGNGIRSLKLFVTKGSENRQVLRYLIFSLGACAGLLAALYGLFNRYCQYRHDRGM